MDSRLLNVFHDDPFDGNYVKYENDTEFWTSESDPMDLQLSETLHGILPIAPTEDVSVLYDNTALKGEYELNSKDDSILAVQTKNATLLDKNLSEQLHSTTNGAVEIVTVDPNAEETDNSDADCDDELLKNIEINSQYSSATFRSRTDSSSIGDYESHTSDYDDDEDDVKHNDEYQSNNRNELLVEVDNDDTSKSKHFLNVSNINLPEDANSKTKNRTFSTNTIGSDVDGFALQIDANTFDLAEFITQDDFALTASSCNKMGKPLNNVKKNGKENVVHRTILSKNVDSDTDSDVIVDVETIEIDSEVKSQLWLEKSKQSLLGEKYQDEISTNDDPSWSPVFNKKKESASKVANNTIQPVVASSTTHQKLNRNYSLVPSKRQFDFLKGKFGTGGRVKNSAMQRRTKSVITKGNDPTIANKKASKIDMNKITTSCSQSTQNNCVPKVGVGQGGKNLALIKLEENPSPPNKDSTKQLLLTEENQDDSAVSHMENVEKVTVKRKLNIEEYKQRRGENFCSNNVGKPKIPKLETEEKFAIVLHKPPNFCKNNIAVTPTKHSEAVTSIVKSLKGELVPRQNLDPITEAKNKVLRMQELKKAQLLKIIDSTVSAKVPRVTKVLPLKDIVKDSYKTVVDIPVRKTVSKPNSDYEEIVIVSVSCNTDISIPPIHTLPNANLDTSSYKNVANNASRSLLKSSALLYSISNTFQKVQATENVKLSTNSLIVSIQDVVVKQTTPSAEHSLGVNTDNDRKKVITNRNFNSNTETIGKNAHDSEQHGEDKVIMHLRKDRIRERTKSVSVQTEILPEFPLLPMPITKFKRISRKRIRSTHIRAKCQLESLSNSMSLDDSSSSDHDSRSYRSRSRSCSSSVERLRRAGTTGGYSSLSSRRHRSSLSSSFSESERNLTRRNRKSNYKQRVKHFVRSSSNSSSDYSDRSRSRTRSRSPIHRRSVHSVIDRNVSQPAVEERRIVYVGRIEQETNKEMLRRKFLPYGPIKQITIHYKDTGMKYGFVTYERSQDAFAVIDNSSRDVHINMYDISFGGRRAFCRSSYADLDNAGINTYHSYVFPKVAEELKEEDSFEALLLKVKAKITANKATTSTGASEIHNQKNI